MVGVLFATLLALSRASEGTVPTARPVRAVVFGDFNGPYGSTTYARVVTDVVTRIISVWRPDVLLSAGDLVAGQMSGLPDTRFSEMWQAFDVAVGRPIRQAGIPIGFALGNHDASAARGTGGDYLFQRERDAAAAYWRDSARRPRLDYRDARPFPFYYSFMVGGIFVLVLDATTHIIQDAPWVLAALRSADAHSARMRIVIGHLPLYGISQGRSKFGEVIEQGEQWRQTFETSGVDLYLSGHHAAYYPAHRGRLRLLHSGGVGARRYVGYPGVRPRSTVTLMQIDPATRTITLETVDVKTRELVELSELPACINGYNGPTFRVDVPQHSNCTSR
jgi:hypothetical protein